MSFFEKNAENAPRSANAAYVDLDMATIRKMLRLPETGTFTVESVDPETNKIRVLFEHPSLPAVSHCESLPLGEVAALKQTVDGAGVVAVGIRVGDVTIAGGSFAFSDGQRKPQRMIIPSRPGYRPSRAPFADIMIDRPGRVAR
jgi:hypothetical protein